MRGRGTSFLILVAMAASTLAASSGQPGVAGSKPHVLLQIKPGLWEFDTQPRVSGDTVIANAISARMPAAQLPSYLAETRKMLEQPSKQRECINQSRFEQQIFSLGAGCTQTFVANTTTMVQVSKQCRSNAYGASQNSISKTVLSSPRSVRTSLHAVTSRQGKTMTVESLETGHWVGANCAM